jgi:large conductance mechanosensitive channel
MWRRFKEFAMQGNVIDLAVGVMLGTAFNTVIQAIVRDFLTPLIGLVGGSPDLSDVVLTVNGTKFAVGDLVNTVIYFALVAVVLFALVEAARVVRRDKSAGPQQTACPYCCTAIAPAATRCPHCTSDLAPAPSQPAP